MTSTAFEFSDNPQFVWIYSFDEKGVFTGTYHYQVPAQSGLPANSTAVPCQPKNGMTGIWDGKKWREVPDLRGVEYWDNHGTPFVVMEMIAALPEWAVTIAPPVAEPAHVLLFADGEWQQLQDMTGKTFYGAYGHTATVPEPYFVLPEDCTFTPPGTPFDTWNGKAWVTDVQAQADALEQEAAQQRQQVVNQAQQQRLTLLTMADQQIRLLEDAIELGMQQDGDADRLMAWKKCRVLVARIDPEAAPDIDWPVMP
ncbi:tail fiber assembly protein [Serratia entomophila]|uniref:tail fiber assembly protein n=1 Tax=Serratia entomophila TaxID=42906 RepID=UPI00217B10C3|nr:tail fiber assembly protein [Serratia entomophila]CAI1096837.1 Caudovirales tail fibre assembly protein [Serratia entomophila]CAI1887684.1 Caudovirales tail fibre assembly protein [Serratia entomophila]